jgi:hypothetical protein
MPETRDRYESFYCSKLGKDVTIYRKELIHRSSATGEIDHSATTQIDCEQSSECDVSPDDLNYDWSKCVHPDLKR